MDGDSYREIVVASISRNQTVALCLESARLLAFEMKLALYHSTTKTESKEVSFKQLSLELSLATWCQMVISIGTSNF